MTTSVLGQFMAELLSGKIKIVDLTETLTPEFPTIVLPPEFGQAWPFRIEEISRYDERGPAWYWNNFSCSEHTGTHFDAPVHWVSGKDQPNNTVDTIPVESFIAEACVIDCSEESRANPDFLLTIEFVEQWEARHGRIPARSWVFMRTDWSKRAKPVDYLNMDDEGAHSPGPDAQVVPWLIKERDVHGFGTESVGTDAGQAQHLDPPFPCHYYMHGNNRYGLQCMTNLHHLPPTGAVIFSAPLKIRSGSGSPLRVLALVPSHVASGESQ
ncbi:MAG TPA: cyclase family protein [Pusillimonas sp.]|uniref:cyclase family protein n=1 Tax=Pusillimonas sp. TaxID=3040095 RepID=UPI002BC86757|nr:cyclase family protein [Pusillimonas sp.]HUH86903.1 cyclase family protein [Pusillimonas sp.]